MKLKWFMGTIAITLLVVIAFLGLAGHDSAVAAQEVNSKIEGLLLDKFAAEGSADFIVRFTQQADLSPAYSMDWESRGEFVYNTLLETAATSQVSAKVILDAAGLKYETFIAGNDLFVAGGTLSTANELAALPEVSFIRATRTYYIDPVSVAKPFANITWVGSYLADNLVTTVGNAPLATTDWGITDTKADQAWLLGARGQGIKVANIDTGVQWNHPALVNQFACPGDPTNAACWRDPSNICGASGACDNNGHGTHTMGTMVSKDDPALTYIAGMAPDATWIACKGCESSSCSDTALNTCADWILAPGGSSANRPHIVNNSWGGGGNDPWYQAKVVAWRAAGIFPAFSAGNNTGCGSMGSPGDYQESFASTGHTSARVHAWSQGPSAFGHEPYTKPNITAPSNSICSTVPTNGWNCGYSGTSMASPHSAGAVAQVWSVCPALVGQLDLTFEALQDTADAPDPVNPACGVPPDGEGTYEDGYGYLNALLAVQSCLGTVDYGALDGHVYDDSMSPVEGATVTAQPSTEGAGINAITDPTGYYTMTLVVGTYDVTASKAGYEPQTIPGVEVITDTVTTQDFQLTYIGAWTAGADTTPCFDWYRYDGEYFASTGKIYFLGGRTGTVTDGTIYSYDPVTGVCADTGADMPNPISNYTVNLVNNGTKDLLCTFGGRQADGATTLNVQCYDPVANTATVVTNLPTAWTGYTPGAQVVVDNQVFIFGGFNPTVGMIGRTEKYDPVANSFSQLGDLSLARSYIMATAVDGIIYAFGGDTWDGVSLIAQTRAEKMDPAVGTWNDASLADLPTAGDEGQAFGFNTDSPFQFSGQIVIATLSVWSGNSSEVVLYDVATNTYDSTFPDTLEARRNHAGVFVPIETDNPADGLPGMWVFGGYLTSDNPPYAGTEFYPVNRMVVDVPDISIPPVSLTSTQAPDTTQTITFTINNTGTAALEWGVFEKLAGKILGPSSPFVPVKVGGGLANNQLTIQSPASTLGAIPQAVNPEAVLWDQPLSSVNQAAYVNQEFSDYPTYSSFLADDFVADEDWAISTFFVPGDGWNGFSTILNAEALTWQIYADNAGIPAGDPTGGGDDPLWTLSLLPTDPQVLLTNGTGGLLSNVQLNLNVPLALPAGHYWFVFYPTLEFGAFGQHGRQPSDTTNGSIGQFINPGGGFALGTDWQDWTVLGSPPTDIAFRLEGSLLVDVPWLSEAPDSGTVSAGGSADVGVTFDSTGLAEGDYYASLEVISNDPDDPSIMLPVKLTVQIENFHTFLTIVSK